MPLTDQHLRTKLVSRCWHVVANRLRQFAVVRSAGSPDLHQARMRFLVLIGCCAYAVFIDVVEHELTTTQAVVMGIDAALFGLFSLYMHAYFRRDPTPDPLRRALGLFADHAAALACLAATGRSAGALAWLPLFIIQGVGIRFGVRWLFASQAIGIASVGVVFAVNPFFRENGTVGVGAILSVLVLPLYFALLAIREARVKAELEHARLCAEAASEAKDRFVAMISHELRTPLTGILGLNELLRKQGLPVHSQQMLAEQQAATSLMLGMVNDVLDLSKVEAGQMQLEAVDFDPQELALGVLQALSFQARQKGLSIRIELDATVPSAVNGSPFHITRILQNLLSNAIKFTPAGSVTLRVNRQQAVLADGESIIQFEVADTGIGIPPEALSKIFDRFYQVDAAVTRRFGGTGLGTSLVKEFCDLLHGSVRIDSVVAQGTRCYVALPFRQPQRSGPAAAFDGAGMVVGAWTESIGNWAGVKAQLLGAGASVHELGKRRLAPTEFDRAAEAGACATVVVMGGPASSHTLAATSAMGLTDPAYILVADCDSGDPCAPMQGRITIRARSDDYSVTRALRLAALTAPPGGSAAPVRRSASESHGLRGAQAALKVLVAEDTPTIRLVMCAILESAAFSIVAADDGAEALSKAACMAFDVIVLDRNMPELDGIGVLRHLRAGSGPNARTPVIIATAAPSQELIDEAMDAGALAVLGKPFVGDELLRVVVEAAACAVKIPPAGTATPDPATPVASRHEVTLILDMTALEAPGSVFKVGDSSLLVSAFLRDAPKKKELFKRAVADADFALFRASVHSLSGYAGAFGARRLEWLLSIAPQDAAAFKNHGPTVVAEICDTLTATAGALDEWSKASSCATH